MKETYFESVVMIERLHRLFLDVVRIELDRMGVRDISNVQSLILYNIGKEQLSVGELTQRGYYLGSNVSYNLRKMIENGYVMQEQSPHDRRSSNIRLSEKGLKLYQKIDDVMAVQSTTLEKEHGTGHDLKSFTAFLRGLETFWSGIIARDNRR